MLPQYPCSHLNCSVLCPDSVAQTQKSIKSFANRKNDTVRQTDVPIAYAEATGLTYHSENKVSLIGMWNATNATTIVHKKSNMSLLCQCFFRFPSLLKILT